MQGPVWGEAVADPHSGVGRWFSWGRNASCEGVAPGCPGRRVVVPGIGCAQGSWASEDGFSGEQSAMASFGSRTYADYLVDSYSNSWTGRLGIDGYCEDVSANIGCMMQTATVSDAVQCGLLLWPRTSEPRPASALSTARPAPAQRG